MPLSQSQLKEARVGKTFTTGGHFVSGSPCDLEGIYSVPCPKYFLCPFWAQALHGSGERGSASRSPLLLAPGAIRLVYATADARAHGAAELTHSTLWSCLLPPTHIPLPDSSANRLGSSRGSPGQAAGRTSRLAQHTAPVLRPLNPSPRGWPRESEFNKPLGCCCASEDPGPARGVVGAGTFFRRPGDQSSHPGWAARDPCTRSREG